MNRIAFLCHPYHRGGVTSWMAAAARESALQGIKTYFITVDPKSAFISSGGKPSMIELIGEVPANLQIIAPKAGFEFELGTNMYRSAIYSNAIRKSVPAGTTIIVSDDPSVWLGAALLSTDYPMLGVMHSSMDPGYFELADTYQNYLAGLVCVSNRTKQNLEAKVKDLRVPKNVIPCGITLTDYKSQQSVKDPSDKLLITWVGRLEEVSKRVSDIPLIAAELVKQNIDFSIKVLGAGPELSSLKEAIEARQLSGRIELLGWQTSPQIIEVLSTTDILLQTSNYEGMSVTVMEALASGCGVVSSRVSGVEDYETSPFAENCMGLYTTGNITEAAGQIIALASVKAELRISKSQTFADDEFSIKACVQKYINTVSGLKPSLNKLELPESKLWISIKSRTLALIRKIKFEIRRR